MCKKNLYHWRNRFCARCGELFKTQCVRGKICDKCLLPRGNPRGYPKESRIYSETPTFLV